MFQFPYVLKKFLCRRCAWISSCFRLGDKSSLLDLWQFESCEVGTGKSRPCPGKTEGHWTWHAVEETVLQTLLAKKNHEITIHLRKISHRQRRKSAPTKWKFTPCNDPSFLILFSFFFFFFFVFFFTNSFHWSMHCCDTGMMKSTLAKLKDFHAGRWCLWYFKTDRPELQRAHTTRLLPCSMIWRWCPTPPETEEKFD